jgi:hypothetical protein
LLERKITGVVTTSMNASWNDFAAGGRAVDPNIAGSKIVNENLGE